jgi:hypothetical protein
MISRSDGSSFHLLLADRPLPYPHELSSGPSSKLSVCFWYSHVSRRRVTCSTVVTLRAVRANSTAAFHSIERIADLLAEDLCRQGGLAKFYDFRGDLLFELPV